MPVLDTSVKSLLADLHLARLEGDRLFAIIAPEAIYERPIDARHRVLFYVGHLDGFDSIQICREGLGIDSQDSDLDHLFQAGIDPDSSDLPRDQPSDWPSVKEVLGYVQRCRDRVDRYIENAPEETVFMALEHRQMHLETLTYMFHNFDQGMKIAPPASPSFLSMQRRIENAWRRIPAGDATLGRASDDCFGWDNEYELHSEFVPAFRIQRYAVTNGEYLEFVKQGASLPHFWIRRGDSFYLRGMFEELALPLDWPAYVTQQQASTYARWIGKALPTEAQFHRAAYGSYASHTRKFPWGDESPTSRYGNFDFRRWDPEPVDATPAGDSAFGVSQLVGNGWEWTKTPFGPFPGFKPRASYPGYSANFFDGRHFVLKGGSPRTASRLLRSSFRNWFRSDYPYIYAKFHCVDNE